MSAVLKTVSGDGGSGEAMRRCRQSTHNCAVSCRSKTAQNHHFFPSPLALRTPHPVPFSSIFFLPLHRIFSARPWVRVRRNTVSPPIRVPRLCVTTRPRFAANRRTKTFFPLPRRRVSDRKKASKREEPLLSLVPLSPRAATAGVSWCHSLLPLYHTVQSLSAVKLLVCRPTHRMCPTSRKLSMLLFRDCPYRIYLPFLFV